MAWVRLDDQAPRNNKMLKAGPAACWLWVCGIAHSQSQLTDGFISLDVLSMIGVSGVSRVKKLAEVLVAVGLFDRVDGGYHVHDYLEFNASAEDVKAEREWDRRRKELYADPELVRAIKERDQNSCRYCGRVVNWTDRRGPIGGQFDHVVPRGDNSLENVVVACRRCNIKKNNRPLSATGMSLRPEPKQNQGGPSSSLLPIPSHPIPSHPKPSASHGGPTSGGVLTGGLPREHLRHAWCGRKCVPDFLHAEFLRAFGGDVDVARVKLTAFYEDICAALPEGPVGDEPVRFWRERFAAIFSTPKPEKGRFGTTVEQDVDAVRAQLKREGVL